MGIENATPGILVLFFLMLGPLFYYIEKAKKNKNLYVRKIAGIDAIDEAIGRSAEMGRPMSFSTGLTSISPTLYAVLGVLMYVSKKAAIYRNKLLVPQNNPEVMAIVENVVRDGYRAEGRISAYNPQNIRYLSQDQFAFASGYQGMMHRENVASAFLFGYFAAESLILAEAGKQVGAMQIGASVSPEQVPFFICTCDYTLISEELFASSAYLSRDHIQLGSLIAQDKAKLIIFVLLIIGILIATVKSFYPEISLPNIERLVTATYSEVYEYLRGI